jgi:hypothetical protein
MDTDRRWRGWDGARADRGDLEWGDDAFGGKGHWEVGSGDTPSGHGGSEARELHLASKSTHEFFQANALFHSLFSVPGKSLPPIPSDIQGFFDQNSTPPEIIRDLTSLVLALSSTTRPRNLPITLTSLVGPNSTSPPGTPLPTPTPIPSHIVLSTSLHAAILKSSEALRSSHPGVERFKIAAQENVGVFFSAKVRLAKTSQGRLEQYRPSARAFGAPFTAISDEGEVVLEGPFAYFLSTTTTPRLEATFVINPTLDGYRHHAPDAGSPGQ